MEQEKKKMSKKKGCLIAIAIWVGFMFVMQIVDKCTNGDRPKAEKQHYVEDYNDGSKKHQERAKFFFVKYLKDNFIKDPDSYEEIEYGTLFNEEKKVYQIQIKFRAKNSFGGYVIETVYGEATFDANKEPVFSNIMKVE